MEERFEGDWQEKAIVRLFFSRLSCHGARVSVPEPELEAVREA